MTDRRHFLAAIAAGLSSGTPMSWAQTSPARVAWLSVAAAADGSIFLDELRRGLRELKYVEGRNIVLDAYWGEDSPARVEKLLGEALTSRPSVIVVQGNAAVVARRANTSIPVVFGYSGDPVEAGLVESMPRPGRNMTGISYLVLELVGKRMELLKEALPSVKRLAVIANPQHPGDKAERRISERSAAAFGMTIDYFEASSPQQLGDALTAVEKARSDALMLFPVQYVISNRERIAAWSIKNRIPAISGWAQFAEGGNLMSYGANLRETSRRLASFVDRIIKGAKPADLPVEMPTQVELVINRKAAKALGIALPQKLLLRADRVID